MNTPFDAMESFTDWLLNSSLQAAVLVGAVMLAQRLVRKQLTPRWRCALWWLVLLRLLLPAAM